MMCRPWREFSFTVNQISKKINSWIHLSQQQITQVVRIRQLLFRPSQCWWMKSAVLCSLGRGIWHVGDECHFLLVCRRKNASETFDKVPSESSYDFCQKWRSIQAIQISDVRLTFLVDEFVLHRLRFNEYEMIAFGDCEYTGVVLFSAGTANTEFKTGLVKCLRRLSCLITF
jgi:hypothetical protein